MRQQRERQVKEYLESHTMSLPAHFTMDSTKVINAISNSQPTLNAINQQAVANLTSNHIKPQSPMAVTSPSHAEV